MKKYNTARIRIHNILRAHRNNLNLYAPRNTDGTLDALHTRWYALNDTAIDFYNLEFVATPEQVLASDKNVNSLNMTADEMQEVLAKDNGKDWCYYTICYTF